MTAMFSCSMTKYAMPAHFAGMSFSCAHTGLIIADAIAASVLLALQDAQAAALPVLERLTVVKTPKTRRDA